MIRVTAGGKTDNQDRGATLFPAEQAKQLVARDMPLWETVPGFFQLTGSGDSLTGTIMVQPRAGNCPHGRNQRFVSIREGQLQLAGFPVHTPWWG
jgi:hypothetical protein